MFSLHATKGKMEQELNWKKLEIVHADPQRNNKLRKEGGKVSENSCLFFCRGGLSHSLPTEPVLLVINIVELCITNLQPSTMGASWHTNLYLHFALSTSFKIRVKTYCLTSWALSPSDGEVHSQIKYCNGTAKSKRRNCSPRGIVSDVTCWNNSVFQASTPACSTFGYDIFRRRVESRSRFLLCTFWALLANLRHKIRTNNQLPRIQIAKGIVIVTRPPPVSDEPAFYTLAYIPFIVCV